MGRLMAEPINPYIKDRAKNKAKTHYETSLNTHKHINTHSVTPSTHQSVCLYVYVCLCIVLCSPSPLVLLSVCRSVGPCSLSPPLPFSVVDVAFC
jgi:hypothetical protein